MPLRLDFGGRELESCVNRVPELRLMGQGRPCCYLRTRDAFLQILDKYTNLGIYLVRVTARRWPPVGVPRRAKRRISRPRSTTHSLSPSCSPCPGSTLH